ncbi:response regulator transcription factor [Sulfurimonas sp.]|uniref:response regulator transcription factor n=1 Tax=Sulfurimonas sp. TaxID=2022749 RepID=UPI00356AD7D2
MIANLLLLKNKTVLFAEDDKIIREQTIEILGMIFDKVFWAEDGQKAFELYEDESPDIIISDIKMPNVDGLQLVDKIRSVDYKIPIVLLTSFTEQKMLLDAANLSVDGYVIKPIELNTLISTISKAMKRVEKNVGIITLQKDLFFNSGTQELYQNGFIVSLGVKELELIKLLIDNRSRTVTKDEISEALWPLDSTSESSIKNLVLRIRKKLNTDIIVSVRGIGYRLNTRNMPE